MMGFSEKKFLAFDTSKQKKELYKLLRLIEKNYYDFQSKGKFIREFNLCLEYLKNNRNTFFSNLEKISQNSTLREITAKIMKFNNEMNKNEKDSDFIIEKFDGENSHKIEKSQLIVILDNLRSAFNVGSIFRTAECSGIKKLFLSGYTPNPQNKKVKETSMGTYKFMDWDLITSTENKIKELKDLGYKIYGFETVDTAENLPEVKFTEKACFIFGNEALGIPKKILKECDVIVKIPVFGWKNSLNVGVSFAIGVYEYLKQYKGDN